MSNYFFGVDLVGDKNTRRLTKNILLLRFKKMIGLKSMIGNYEYNLKRGTCSLHINYPGENCSIKDCEMHYKIQSSV